MIEFETSGFELFQLCKFVDPIYGARGKASAVFEGENFIARLAKGCDAETGEIINKVSITIKVKEGK